LPWLGKANKQERGKKNKNSPENLVRRFGAKILVFLCATQIKEFLLFQSKVGILVEECFVLVGDGGAAAAAASSQ
jgi:hypothetical protein